jgi:hypothetical protein
MILGIGRSGSTHLQQLLDSHPAIRCLGELFTPGHGLFETASTTDHRRYLDELAREAAAPVFGFKHMWPALYAYPQTLDLLRDPNLRIVRAKRWNLLALYVSVLLVEDSGVGHSFQGRYAAEQVHVDVEQCLANIHNCYFTDLVLDELVRGSSVADITYEHLTTNADEVLDGLQRFLGVEPQALQSRSERMRTRSLEESIENWDEVCDALRGTAWEDFLDGAG